MTMARRSRISVNDVLEQLDSDDCFDCEMAEGSDDDLGMNTDYDYESDSSVEGIIHQNKFQNILCVHRNAFLLRTRLLRLGHPFTTKS